MVAIASIVRRVYGRDMASTTGEELSATELLEALQYPVCASSIPLHCYRIESFPRQQHRGIKRHGIRLHVSLYSPSFPLSWASAPLA